MSWDDEVHREPPLINTDEFGYFMLVNQFRSPLSELGPRTFDVKSESLQ